MFLNAGRARCSNSLGAGGRNESLIGRVAAVRGTVVEVDIAGPMPSIETAVECRLSDDASVTAVVQAHVDRSRVRTIAIEATRGLKHGAEVWSAGEPLTVPVGRELLGRVIDLEGNPLDGGPPVNAQVRRSLHRSS